MIIFDLDGCLADNEHRKHFIQIPWDYCHNCYSMLQNADKYPEYGNCSECKRNPFTWKMDWKAYHEACDKDKPVESVLGIFNLFLSDSERIEVWSGRCESAREKTHEWLVKYTLFSSKYPFELIMRPIGDNSPDHELKEQWLDDYIIKLWPELAPVKNSLPGMTYKRNDPIDFVFDADPASIAMWKRRKIFVFDVNQSGDDESQPYAWRELKEGDA